MKTLSPASAATVVALILTTLTPSGAQDRPREGRPEQDAGEAKAPPSPEQLEFRDGVATIADRKTFKKLSYQGPMRMDAYLSDLEFVKFILVRAGAADAQLYFMNTKTHQAHPRFMSVIGMRRSRGRGGFGGPGRGGGDSDGPKTIRGAITYRPLVRAPNGEPGLYTYDFQPGDAFSVKLLKTTEDALVEKAPFLKGKIGYHPLSRSAERIETDKADFEKAGIAVYLDKDLSTDLAYLPLNAAAGFGRLRVIELNELPTPRDIVLYKTLPNELPRVAGIITSVRQTPLSHVNLRAIQDKVPNAFVKSADTNGAIKPLIGKYVHYEVAADGFEIREATKSEVEAHFAKLRPTETQLPKRDLSAKQIKKLDDIAFSDSAVFGVKTSNLASLRRFGLPEGTAPDGFGIPFHFYDEFMKHNDLYAKAKSIVDQPEFRSNTERQEADLARLRGLIEQGEVPGWMQTALGKLQTSFPEGTPIRCRSSTNNEDLPGFSGAGLYDSVTHHPTEGHLSESIKQVFASLWSYRAFTEREFYRIDHFATAMGVLVHPNFDDEKANGVAVTEDVLYQTQGNYYLNTQVGEDLVTNPEKQSVPEEILLGWWADDGFEVRQHSSRKKEGELILDKAQLDLLRKCLTKIHGKFAKLYEVDLDAPGFAMEIEYKITKDGALKIKQARPWVFAGK